MTNAAKRVVMVTTIYSCRLRIPGEAYVELDVFLKRGLAGESGMVRMSIYGMMHGYWEPWENIADLITAKARACL